MLKKVSVLLALGAAYAVPTQANIDAPRAFSGFGIGANLGYITGESTLHRHWEFSGKSDKTDLNGRGIIGGVHIDYGHVFSSCWYAGIEAFALFSSLKAKAQDHQLTALPNSQHVRMEDSYGGALRIGGLIRGVLPYVKVGGVGSRWKFTSDYNATKKHAHKREYRGGVVYGLGVDIPLTERLIMGGEFTHTDYAKLTVTHKDAAGNALIKHKVQPRQNTFMMKIKFRI